jgi:DNA-binding HxlR family transcriptional regulator
MSQVVADAVPLCADYLLSDTGDELVPVIEAMCGWGTKHLGVAPNLPRPVLKPA